MFIDFPVVDNFFGFTKIDSTWISNSKRSVLIYQISYCKVLFDLLLKNLTKNWLTAAIEQKSNMLTFNNTSVNIKGEDGFYVPYESENISGKVKNCSITNFTGGQVLVVIKNIRKQNHLGLNNMLLNYYKWRQIVHCKRFCYCQWSQMALVSNKIYIIGFPKRNFFDHWKAYCRKRVIYALKTCRLTKFYTPLYMSSKTNLL